MSHFLCGKFILKRTATDEQRAEFAFKVNRLAAERDISLHLQWNIVQTTVFEILNLEKSNLSPSEIPFLITDTPLSDVSEELLSPFRPEPLEVFDAVERNLHQLGDFLGCAFFENIVEGVEVIFSEGYDIEYRKLRLPLASFVDECLNIFKQEGSFPSLQVVLQKNEVPD